MAYNIEKNVPLRSSKRHSYPFEVMMPGDSFEAPVSEYRKVMNAATFYRKQEKKLSNRNLKFAIRKVNDSTVRVWLISETSGEE